MISKSGKFLLILLIPAVVYGALKGVMYYNAKRAVDDIVRSAANQADIRYAGISTELRGAVTVSGVTVQPLGYQDSVAVDTIRIASDDPMFFIRGTQWQPGEGSPPNSLSFAVNGLHLPLSSDILQDAESVRPNADQAPESCAQGLDIQPQMLRKIGLSELGLDLDGHYRLNASERTLEIGMNMDLHDIESMQLAATMTDVDVEALAQGGAPQLNLGRFSVAVRVSPEFGRKALKACAAGSGQTAEEWSAILAARSLEEFERQGLSLGSGLSNAVRDFYRDWGEFKLVAAPSKPVGLLSLMFLPPEQLADALALHLSLNGKPITDTRFSWEQPTFSGLAGMFGGEAPETQSAPANRPRRVLVRREYEDIAVSDIARYVDHQVQIKPRGQPLREGLLKRIRNGEAEVEQVLHGGKFTAYVPLAEIDSVQALVQRELQTLK